MPEGRIASRKRSGHSPPSDNRTHPRSRSHRFLRWTAGYTPRAVTPVSLPKESFRRRVSARPGSNGSYALATPRPRDVRSCSPGPPRQRLSRSCRDAAARSRSALSPRLALSAQTSETPRRTPPLSIASVFLLESVHAHHPPVIAERRGQAREREGSLPWRLSRWTSIESRQALLVKTQFHTSATARLYFQAAFAAPNQTARLLLVLDPSLVLIPSAAIVGFRPCRKGSASPIKPGRA